MELTRERTVYLAVLVVAGGAFAVDRFALGGGASSASAAAVPAQPDPGATPAARPDAPRAASVRERLERLAPAETPDAFRAPDDWLPKASGVPLAAHPDPAPASRPTLRLTSIMITGDQPEAVINAKHVALGSEIEGVRIIAIDPSARAVWVEFQGETWELRLPSPAVSKP